MFIKNTSKSTLDQNGKLNTYNSFYLVTKVKSPETGKYQERIILNLSPAFSLDKPLWKPLCNKIDQLLNPKPANPLFKELSAIDEEINRLASNIVKSIRENEASIPFNSSLPTDPGEELVKIKDIYEIHSKSAGAERIVLKAINNLHIPDILDDLGFTRKQVKLTLAQIAARLLHPASERETSRWLQGNSSLVKLLGLKPADCYSMALHRVGDLLGNNKEEIEERLFDNRSLFDGPYFYVFFDLTNVFLEGNAEGMPDAKRGFSKEKRFDCPLLSLALCINHHGSIIQSQGYPGNISEPSTLKEVVAKSSVRKGDIIVMDKGIATKENLEWLNQEGYYYVVAERTSKREFDPELASEYKTASGSIIEAYRVEDEENPGQVRLICHSLDRESKEFAMLEKAAEKLEKNLKEIDEGLSRPRTVKDVDKLNRRIGRLLEICSIVSKYYEIEIIPDESNPKVATAIRFKRNDKPGSKGEFPGVYSLLTNNSMLSAEEILRIYLRLTTVESAFRCLKSELGVRPIYHKLGYRADNHIFISILAYEVVNEIRTKMKAMGINDSWTTIRNVAAAQNSTLLIAKANSCERAVLFERRASLTLRINKYYIAMGIDKKSLKHKHIYVP
jgi:transposase